MTVDGGGGAPRLCLLVGGNLVWMLNAEIKKQEIAELNSVRLCVFMESLELLGSRFQFRLATLGLKD